MYPKAVLQVSITEGHETIAYTMEIEAVYTEAFAPLCTTDDTLVAMATGDLIAGSLEAERIVKLKKTAAEYLAKQITEKLLNAMQSRDTHNGYRIVKE